MLDSIMAGGLTLPSLIICSIVSLVLGLVVALVHVRTTKHTKNLAVALVVLPILVQIVMMMVNGNLGIGVAILGAFSLVRFRSIPGTSREIVSVFFAMAIGLATGTGYIGFALLATILIGTVLLILSSVSLFAQRGSSEQLKITLPEDADYQTILADVFNEHAVVAELTKIKTKNMGSLYELTFSVELPSEIDRKQFIDDIRVRNSNLPIVLFQSSLEGGL